MVSFLFSLYFIYHIVCKILKKYKSFSGHPPLPPRQSLNTPHPPIPKQDKRTPHAPKQSTGEKSKGPARRRLRINEYLVFSAETWCLKHHRQLPDSGQDSPRQPKSGIQKPTSPNQIKLRTKGIGKGHAGSKKPRMPRIHIFRPK